MATRIPDEQVQQLLQRAAELQQATDVQSQNNQNEEIQADHDSGDRNTGFDLAVLQAAAFEVGISSDNINLAAAELNILKKPVPESAMIKAEKFLNYQKRSLTVSKTLAANPTTVLNVLNTLAPSAEFKLKLREVTGTDPTTDGILIYDVPTMEEWSSDGSRFAMGMYYADLKNIFVIIRNNPKTPNTTDITIHASLTRTLRLNYLVGKGCVYGLGALSVVGVLVLTSFNPLLTLGIGLPTAMGTGMLTHRGYRWIYSWGLKKGKTALVQLAQAIEIGCKALSWNK